jgi:hypothetical protein
MTTLLVIALGVLSLVLFAVREPTTDSRSPAELVAAARAAGWGRVAFTAARVGLVAALLVLVQSCKLFGHGVAAVGAVLAVLATVAAVSGGRSLIPGGTA